MLVDTSGVFASLDRGSPDHSACRRAAEQHPGPLLLSPFVLAELDYLLMTRIGQAAALQVLDDVGDGRYTLLPFGIDEVRAAGQVVRRHLDLTVGLADASIVVLAERHGVHDVLTLDERHFRILTGPGGRPFRVLPADA